MARGSIFEEPQHIRFKYTNFPVNSIFYLLILCISIFPLTNKVCGTGAIQYNWSQAKLESDLLLLFFSEKIQFRQTSDVIDK